MKLHGSNVTAQIINNNVKRLTNPVADEPSLTLSTMPVIEPEIANKGVDKAQCNGDL